MTTWLPGAAYPEALIATPGGVRIEHGIPERPLLHVCCNQDHFGTVNVDADPSVNPDVVADVLEGLPFENDSFEACFADLPWVKNWMQNTSRALKEMLRIAPVVYLMCPWMVGGKYCRPESIHVCWKPGIHYPILFVKYVRTEAFE